MGAWYCFMAEAKCSDEWINIDQWCRQADGSLRHQYLLAAAARDLFSCDFDELATTKGPLRFCELAPTTQEIIQMRNPVFPRSSLDTFEFCLWGDVNDFERLLEKTVEEPEYPEITKAFFRICKSRVVSGLSTQILAHPVSVKRDITVRPGEKT